MAEGDDNKHKTWQDLGFVQENGLNEFNVMEYFKRSIFYDKAALNEFPGASSQMKGIEFQHIQNQDPNIYIIAKQNKLDSERFQPLSYYYITKINGIIYQAPVVAQLFDAKLKYIFNLLYETYVLLQEPEEKEENQNRKFTKLEQDEGKRTVDQFILKFQKQK